MAKRNSETRAQTRAQARSRAKSTAAASVRLVAGGVLVAGTAGAGALVGGAGLAGAEDVGTASTYTVLNTNDSGDGSLRQAVLAANGNGGADTITFDLGVTGTITLTTGEIEISDSVTITGPGSSVLDVSGNDASRVFRVTGTADVEITGLGISDGSASSGSALRSEQTGSLVLYDVDIHDNYTNGWAALYARNNGTVTIGNSSIRDNTTVNSGSQVSGVYTRSNVDAVTITGTTVTGNVGTGSVLNLYAVNDISLVDVTVADNSSTNSTGFAPTLFLYSSSGDTIISNSTFSGNDGAGDNGRSLIFSIGPTFIYNSTMTGNTGMNALRFISDTEIDQSTVTDNDGYEVWFSSNASKTLTASGSIISDGEAEDFHKTNSGTLTVDSDHSIIGGLGANVSLTDAGGTQTGVTDLGLGALADNGGPTRTMLPQAGSPAIDAGPDPVATFPGNEYDQRGPGYDRISGGRADVGAVEVQAVALLSVTPPHGPLAGGTLLTLSGTGFAEGMTVTVGGRPCTGLLVLSATEATCLTPPGLEPGPVDVVVTLGSSATLRLAFTYDPEDPTFTG